MKKNAVILLFFTIISKLLGIVRESFLTFYYGASYITDAYVASSAIPNVLFSLIAVGLTSTFIPIYSQIYSKEGQKRADKYLDNILSIVFVITLILIVLGLLFTEELVSLTRGGFTGETFLLTVKMLKVTLFAMLFNGIFNIFNGYQQYHGRFLVGPVGGFVLNFVLIISIVVSYKTNPIVLPIGLVIASIFQVIVTYLVARSKSNYRFRPAINLKDRYLRPMFTMAIPIIFGSSIGQINILIDGSFASKLAEGSTSILNYASHISYSVFALFVTTLTTIIYPTLVKQVNSGKMEEFKNTIVKSLNTISIIMIPSTIGLMVLSQPISKLFFGRGNMSEASLKSVSTALVFTSIGLIALGLTDLLVRSFYSLQDSKSPLMSGIIGVIINITLNFLFVPIMGIAGLALATSISSIIVFLFLFVKLNNMIKDIPIIKFFVAFVKIFFASLVMGLVVSLLYNYLNKINIDYKISMFTSIGLSSLVYVFVLYLFKVEELQELLEMFLSKIRMITIKK